MTSRYWSWPYAAKSVVQYEFDIDQLNIWVTFKFSMDQTVKPAHNLWICEVDDVEEDVTVSAWQDEFTLLLTVPGIAGLPDRVTLEYQGPSTDLRTTWLKQWEPWGPILGVELPSPPGTKTFSTGPVPQDDVDVAGVHVLFLDCAANSIVIGAFIGGINGQVLHVARLCAAVNDATLEHNELTANQNIFLHKGLDETLTGEYGGWALVCNGTNWYDISHAKHV